MLCLAKRRRERLAVRKDSYGDAGVFHYADEVGWMARERKEFGEQNYRIVPTRT